MEELNKSMSYEEFKEKLYKDLKRYFSDAELRKPNYELRVREEEDAYEAVEEMLYLSDMKHPEKEVPSYSLAVAYETYSRSGNLELVMELLANVVETQYPKENVSVDLEEAPVRNNVDEIEGNPEEDIKNAYLITAANGDGTTEAVLKDDETLASIAEKEDRNLQLIPVSERGVLAVPVDSGIELEANLEIMAELNKLQLKETDIACQVYDRSRNLLISDVEEMKELLEKGKVKKKSMFIKQ